MEAFKGGHPERLVAAPRASGCGRAAWAAANRPGSACAPQEACRTRWASCCSQKAVFTCATGPLTAKRKGSPAAGLLAHASRSHLCYIMVPIAGAHLWWCYKPEACWTTILDHESHTIVQTARQEGWLTPFRCQTPPRCPFLHWRNPCFRDPISLPIPGLGRRDPGKLSSPAPPPARHLFAGLLSKLFSKADSAGFLVSHSHPLHVFCGGSLYQLAPPCP